MHPKSTRTARVCPQCSKTFLRKAALPFRFCSVRCARKSQCRPVEERFWEKVNKNGPIPEHAPELGPCWLWTAGNDGKYGSFHDGQRLQKAHRFAHVLTHGSIPEGMVLRHRCHRTHCVNPAHLTPGTYSQNLIERYRFGASSDTPAARRARIGRVEILCQHCGLFFSLHASRAKSQKYCSYAHAVAARYGADPVARFWANVEKTDTCWLWKGALSDGYGVTTWHGRHMGTHRVAWLILVGPIPGRLFVCHNCPGGDNPQCCRPDHMFLGTHKDNSQDASRKGKTTKGRTTPPERHIRGEACPWTKLNEADVRSARERAATGETQASIAASLGVTPSLIGYIVRRKSWRHVE